MATSSHSGAAQPAAVDHGRRFLIAWIVLSLIATPLAVIFLGPEIPPGNASAQATQQVFDNTWLLGVSTPVCVFVILFLVYALWTFRNRTGEIVYGAPIRGDNRIQITWLVVTGTTVLFLAGFGTYELL